MKAHVLRHVDAGDRDAWRGDDRLRPASPDGAAQAAAIASAYAGAGLAPVLTSPFTRCVDSVRPLAEATGIDIETTPDLAEGNRGQQVLTLARSGDGDVLLCTHGDVIGDLLGGLVRDGVDIGGRLRARKGSLWVLDLDDDGTVTTATYVASV